MGMTGSDTVYTSIFNCKVERYVYIRYIHLLKINKKMKRMKKMFRAVGLMLFGLLIYNVSNSFFDLEFPNITVESLKQRFSEVNFVGGGNDFGGAIFWLDTQNLGTGITITYSTWASYETRTCITRLRGIYYNNQRWLRLWPLDPLSRTMLQNNWSGYENLSITWGFYRDCSPGDPYSIYGAIEYTLTGGTTSIKSYLAAWTKLDFKNNIMTTWLTNNFQYFNNTTPIGYFYDSAWWIGFVGGTLSWHNNLVTFLNDTGNTINDAFVISWLSIFSTNSWWQFLMSWLNTAQDTLWRLLVQWSLGITKSTNPNLLKSMLGNPQQKTVILGWTDILNSSTILNIARQSAQNLCRGKASLTSTSLPSSPSDSILCFKNTNLNINLSDPTKYANKTIIMESGSINLTGTMHETDGPIEIFINKWALYIENNGDYEDFNTEWFPTSSTSINQGMYIKGNLIINGLLIWGNSAQKTWFDHKLHLEGKIVSFNSIREPSSQRVGQVTALLGASFAPWINLESTFIWYCGFDGKGSDLTDCSTWGIASLIPFIVLNGNFPGNLLR